MHANMSGDLQRELQVGDPVELRLLFPSHSKVLRTRRTSVVPMRSQAGTANASVESESRKKPVPP